jgi:predicted TIM-barrel fold metal-dependent hydrolase
VLQSQAKKSTIIGKTKEVEDACITAKSNTDSPLLTGDCLSLILNHLAAANRLRTTRHQTRAGMLALVTDFGVNCQISNLNF